MCTFTFTFLSYKTSFVWLKMSCLRKYSIFAEYQKKGTRSIRAVELNIIPPKVNKFRYLTKTAWELYGTGIYPNQKILSDINET